LSYQNPIERILVNRRKGIDFDSVRTRDLKLAIAIVQKASPQQSGINAEILPIKALLHSHLPETGGAEDQFILRIIQQRSRSCRQLVGISGSSQKEMVPSAGITRRYR
jgi:hypothetical protein